MGENEDRAAREEGQGEGAGGALSSRDIAGGAGGQGGEKKTLKKAKTVEDDQMAAMMSNLGK